MALDHRQPSRLRRHSSPPPKRLTKKMADPPSRQHSLPPGTPWIRSSGSSRPTPAEYLPCLTVQRQQAAQNHSDPASQRGSIGDRAKGSRQWRGRRVGTGRDGGCEKYCFAERMISRCIGSDLSTSRRTSLPSCHRQIGRSRAWWGDLESWDAAINKPKLRGRDKACCEGHGVSHCFLLPGD